MEDSLAERALLNAITTAHVPTDRPCPTRHLAIAPPYDWSRTYMAAKDMEEYLPGVPLDATLVEATEDGFDVLASDGVTSLVHVVVERRRHQPLRPGDPVVATVAGVGLEGDLLREGRPGEWVIRARTGGDQRPVEEITVTASDVTFSWRVGRDMWMKAVRLAPLRLAARKADWLGIGSLEPVSEDAKAARRALSAGDPAALFGLQDAPELNGQVRGLKSSVIAAFMDTSIQYALTVRRAPLFFVTYRVSPSSRSWDLPTGGGASASSGSATVTRQRSAWCLLRPSVRCPTGRFSACRSRACAHSLGHTRRCSSMPRLRTCASACASRSPRQQGTRWPRASSAWGRSTP